MGSMELFRTIILMQLFFSVAITGYAHILPADAITYTDMFTDQSHNIEVENITSEIQDSLDRQTNIPVIEVGALVFYSGNILLDLLLNFMFALPQMITMFINGLLYIFSINGEVMYYLQLFLTASVSVLYLVGVMQMLTNIRSGRVV